MRSSERARWVLRAAAASGWHEFSASYPPRVTVATTVPRVLLQCLFIVLLGRAAAGEAGARFAFVGAIAYAITPSSVVHASDVVLTEKLAGTWWRTRTGTPPAPLVVFARAWPYLAQAVALSALCVLVVGPLAGMGTLTWRVAGLLPLYAVMAATLLAYGLAGAALAAGRRADVLIGNSLAYLVLLAGGVLVPPGRVPALDGVGAVVPARHGLAAVRALLDGGPFGGAIAAEVAVGLAWAGIAWALLAWQCARARRLGIDDFE